MRRRADPGNPRLQDRDLPLDELGEPRDLPHAVELAHFAESSPRELVHAIELVRRPQVVAAEHEHDRRRGVVAPWPVVSRSHVPP